MADLLLTAMLTPNNQVTYTTLDGTPYRGDDANIVQVPPQHVAQLSALGFTVANTTQVPAGDPLQADVGWAVSQ